VARRGQAIGVFPCSNIQNVNARHKAGHDVGMCRHDYQ